MKSNPEKKKAGRPSNEINWTLFEELCSLQCTQAEMANCLKIHTDTLRDRARQHYQMDDYSEIFKRFSDVGKCSLRRYQFAMSKRNTSMAIWLGKVWLGQRDLDQLAAAASGATVLAQLLAEIKRENAAK